MNRPSILFLNRVYAPDRGATGRILADLAESLAENGWDVHVLTSGTGDQNSVVAGVNIKRLKLPAKQNVLNYFFITLRFLVAGIGYKPPSIIVTMTDPPMLFCAGYILSVLKRTPHIHWSHDVYPDLLNLTDMKPPNFFMRLLKSISFHVLKRCRKIIVIGRCMEGHMREAGLNPKRLAVIPNWADREMFANPESEISAEHITPHESKPLRMNTEPRFRVLYAGNLGRLHPVATILDAASILQLSNPEIEFLFVGQGLGFEKLAAEKARRGLENIRLLPPQPLTQLRNMMQSGDLHLISMNQKAGGLLVPSKLYSALAAERPSILVGPENSEVARVLMDYGAGQVVAQGDPKALAEAVLLYRMDGSRWFQAHKGAQRASENYNRVASVSHWNNCVRSLIRHPAN